MKLLSAFPEGAKIADEQNRFPLHIALSKTVAYSVECIAHIINLHKDAAAAKNDDGLYPLHLACMNHGDPAIISMLVKLYPEALQERGERGRFPLHIVCAKIKDVPASLVREMVDLYPEAARKKDKRGFLPLKLTQDSNQSPEVVELLSPYCR